MAYYLGVDYGTGNTGIAIGQDLTGTAQPLTSVSMRQGKVDHASFDKLMREWQPTAVVVGLPRNQDDSLTQVAPKVIAFANWVHKIFAVPVYFIDERNTTTSAKEFIFAKYNYKGLQKNKVDAISAALILQAYLDGEAYQEFVPGEQIS
ncbi:Holliday junction resolvase RuvX [Psittacicella melopsittaci]|uniref:Putative pre-16S rRNA nuclease n=1 Tax=Psittacicella melopsittaci TaxID=2028576 RepID=A0A3A1Y4C3_9GAMM|nr:Holliday junction resolvase RuvX [Psittacicella melopsittaci]RIY32250.1 Holliday junction resolvase RuvX [Psittacicella melopsittaci]